MEKESYEKEKRLAAFREEIQNLIDQAKRQKEKGEKYNPHLATMEKADSLTEEDLKWWEMTNKEYKISDFENPEEARKFLTNIYKELRTYRSEDPDRKIFIQEIRNRLTPIIGELELSLEELDRG